MVSVRASPSSGRAGHSEVTHSKSRSVLTTLNRGLGSCGLIEFAVPSLISCILRSSSFWQNLCTKLHTMSESRKRRAVVIRSALDVTQRPSGD